MMFYILRLEFIGKLVNSFDIKVTKGGQKKRFQDCINIVVIIWALAIKGKFLQKIELIGENSYIMNKLIK